jgi:hypothetical protein
MRWDSRNALRQRDARGREICAHSVFCSEKNQHTAWGHKAERESDVRGDLELGGDAIHEN